MSNEEFARLIRRLVESRELDGATARRLLRRILCRLYGGTEAEDKPPGASREEP